MHERRYFDRRAVRPRPHSPAVLKGPSMLVSPVFHVPPSETLGPSRHGSDVSRHQGERPALLISRNSHSLKKPVVFTWKVNPEQFCYLFGYSLF